MIQKSVLILLTLLLEACVPGGLFMHDPSTMTPEQLEKYKALGYDAIRCATVYGPPPGGKVTSVTIPKTRAATVKMLGCDVQSIEVGATEKPDKPPETMAPQPKPTIP